MAPSTDVLSMKETGRLPRPLGNDKMCLTERRKASSSSWLMWWGFLKAVAMVVFVCNLLIVHLKRIETLSRWPPASLLLKTNSLSCSGLPARRALYHPFLLRVSATLSLNCQIVRLSRSAYTTPAPPGHVSLAYTRNESGIERSAYINRNNSSSIESSVKMVSGRRRLTFGWGSRVNDTYQRGLKRQEVAKAEPRTKRQRYFAPLKGRSILSRQWDCSYRTVCRYETTWRLIRPHFTTPGQWWHCTAVSPPKFAWWLPYRALFRRAHVRPRREGGWILLR